MPSDMIQYDMTSKMRICMSTLQDSSLDKEGMGLRKFGKTLLLFWRETQMTQMMFNFARQHICTVHKRHIGNWYKTRNRHRLNPIRHRLNLILQLFNQSGVQLEQLKEEFRFYGRVPEHSQKRSHEAPLSTLLSTFPPFQHGPPCGSSYCPAEDISPHHTPSFNPFPGFGSLVQVRPAIRGIRAIIGNSHILKKI